MKKWFKLDENMIGLFSLLVAVCIVFSMLMPGEFLTAQTFSSIASQLPELGLFTLAMFIPMLSGGFNLCIIGTANLTSLLMAWIFISYIPADASMAFQFLMLIVAIVAAIALSMVIGVFTGAMVAYIGAHPILVTLATMTMVNGIGISLTKGAALSGMPELVKLLGSATVVGIPVPMIIFLCVAVAVALLLEKTKLGKCIYMSGSNINATYFSGINTHQLLIAIYTISSVLCVFAGLVMMSRFNSARMGYGDSYLLLTVLAIILGGTDPNGGFGRVFGVICALFVLQIISTGLNLLGVSPHFSLAMWGAVLIITLSAKFFKKRWSESRAVKNSKPLPKNDGNNTNFVSNK